MAHYVSGLPRRFIIYFKDYLTKCQIIINVSAILLFSYIRCAVGY